MSTKNDSTGPQAVVMPPRLNTELITFALAIYDAMLDNPNFPSPTPSLDVFAEHIAEFQEAQTKAATRAKGAATFRDAKKQNVKEDVFHLCDYVQGVVEKNTTPATAVAVIHSAFMQVRKAPKRPVRGFSAKNADVSGTVVLATKAVASAATYYWEYSVDQSTWISVPDTMKARTEISGLTSASTYHFRFRARTRAGRGDYSQIVSLLVH